MKFGPLEKYFQIVWNNSPSQLLQAIKTKLTEPGKQKSAPARPLNLEDAKVFATFETDDGRRIPLYEGYRDRIKSNWRLLYWPTIALMNVRDRIPLTSQAKKMIEQLQSDRTLPASLDEFAEVVTQLAAQYPEELIQSEISSPQTHQPVIAAKVYPEQINAAAQYYRNYASATLKQHAQWTGDMNAEKIAVLEVGCGMGYAVTAMASLGVGKSAGIDSAIPDYRWISERPAISQQLGMQTPKIANRVEIVTGDAAQMPFEDNSFDLVYSASVLEHIHDLAAAFVEMARVLKPRGMMIHSVDPYFSPKGGHGSCTLDFPWGHARLTTSEFCRYVQEFRPYEYDHTVEMYKSLFNSPRISFHEIEQAIGRAGLSAKVWREHWLTDHLATSDIWQEVSRLYPSVGFRDLAVSNLNLILIKL